MLTRPSHIQPTQLDISHPNFPAQSLEWTGRMQREMQETIALTRKTLAESRTAMAEIDRLLARK
jgi:hypothetical protein